MFHHTVLLTVFDELSKGGMRTHVVASFQETLAEHIANGDSVKSAAHKAAMTIFDAQHDRVVERLAPHRTNYHHDLVEGNQLIVKKNIYSTKSSPKDLVAVLQYNVFDEGVDG